MNENELSFKLLGEWVTVETNNRGDHLIVTFGDVVIQDSSGDCVQWPYMEHGSDAARLAVCHKILRETAEASIRSALLDELTDLRKRVKELEED